jgi:hypothetical protein
MTLEDALEHIGDELGDHTFLNPSAQLIINSTADIDP